jgi:hypothetical protein
MQLPNSMDSVPAVECVLSPGEGLVRRHCLWPLSHSARIERSERGGIRTHEPVWVM